MMEVVILGSVWPRYGQTQSKDLEPGNAGFMERISVKDASCYSIPSSPSGPLLITDDTFGNGVISYSVGGTFPAR
jgi:hypothetical protein